MATMNRASQARHAARLARRQRDEQIGRRVAELTAAGLTHDEAIAAFWAEDATKEGR